MRTVRLGIAIVAAAALVPLTATAALAAPPGNDTPDGAIALSLGDTVKQDTTKATTDAQDAKLNQNCGAPYTNASVWYTYKPSSDGGFIVDMSKSDYSGGFMVFAGRPSPRSLLTCGPTTVGVAGTAGTKYYIVAFSDTQVKGGDLVLSLEKAPPAPRLKLTVNSIGLAFKNGDAEVSGTYSCKNATYVDLEGQLTQIWRRVKINGYFFDEPPARRCDGQVHTWVAKVTSDNGLFARGAATVTMFGFVCGPIECTEVDLPDQQVRLHESSVASAGSASVRTSIPAACVSGRGWAVHPTDVSRTTAGSLVHC